MCSYCQIFLQLVCIFSDMLNCVVIIFISMSFNNDWKILELFTAWLNCNGSSCLFTLASCANGSCIFQLMMSCYYSLFHCNDIYKQVLFNYTHLIYICMEECYLCNDETLRNEG